ncbi:MAG: SUMF1/EgtB/PvdO family nonheme iron enzyme [Phocaeicola sp.]
MKKFNFLVTSFLLTASLVSAENVPQWVKAVVKTKTEFIDKQNPSLKNTPVVSSWMKPKVKAESISLNMKGKKQLVLITSGGADGPDYDHAVWGNARLIKADGTVLLLDQVPFTFGKNKEVPPGSKAVCEIGLSGWSTPLKNVNANNRPIKIAGKGYEHALFCHANGMMVFTLHDDFDRFEAEVGIDDASPIGSAYFCALNANPDLAIAQLTAEHPGAMAMLSSHFPDLRYWFASKDDSVEADAVYGMIKPLKQKDYFTKKAQTVLKESDRTKQLINILQLMSELQKISDLQEDLKWLNLEAVELAYNDMKAQKGYDAAKNSALLNELKTLVKSGFDGIYAGNQAAIDNAHKALNLKRDILLANTLLDDGKIVAVRYLLSNDRKAMAPSLGTQANNWSNQESASRGGFNAEIVELSNLRDKVAKRSVYKPSNGSSVADLKMHWSGKKVMFTQIGDDKKWNIFEVALDGNGFKPLVENDEPDLEFYDGTYLPDGRVIATSNIGYQGVPCVSGDDPVGNMVLFNPEDKSLRRLTFDQDANWNPVIMNNGRVMYTRWEYTDLTHYYTRIVMHMNPDGTENKALYGSGEMFPNSTFDMQPLPGHGSAFVGIISGHHGVARSGRLILFDPSKGRSSVAGMTQEIPYRNRPIEVLIKDELVNDVWPQFIKPMPLNDKYFLVSAKLSPDALWGLYLVDIYDNVTCLAQGDGEGYISPILVKEAKTPPAIPDRVKLGEKDATFFIQDIYEGEGLRGIPRGTVKELRIHAYEYAYLKTTSDHNWHGIQSGWDIKRNLGTVPVEEDGSVMFIAPANTPISIQPLDANGVAVQWMRSWVTGQPGEVVSCVGCHEDQNQIVMPKRVAASQKAPVPLKAPEGGIRSFTFDLEVQPILDRACIACHNGEGKAFDLKGGAKDARGYGKSYLNLHPFVHRQGGEGDMLVLTPYEYHANTSELVRILKKGHYNVELTDEEWRKIYNWIDYNAPDKGYFNANELTSIPHCGFDQIERRIELTNKYAGGSGVDWKKEIADYAEVLKGQGPITPVMPEKLAPVKEKVVKAKAWPFTAADAQALQAQQSQTKKVVEIAPGVKVTFVRIPAGEFVMGSYNGEPDAYPTSKVKIEKAFWMAELETSNAQFNAIFPDHNSRHIDQQWKDHVEPGYAANNPEQPVIRVSYQKAMEYCKQLSEKTGMNITLPTEAQWEWACRAGSDSDFWYGTMNSDFGKKDNLADKTTLDFAVSGVDPKPMAKTSSWYPYYTYLPKEESVDDGSLVTVDGSKYEANPFGLYCMHGNVAEWTRSDYVSYPYSAKTKQTSEYKVVRGGSFFERPKFSTSHTRKGFYPYQSVFNVGFRMIIED